MSFLPPRTFPGVLETANEGAIDWGWQGLVAYGSHCIVGIVYPGSFTNVQTLNYHHHFVTTVQWSKSARFHTLYSPSRLRLVSGDTSGKICIFNVAKAQMVRTFQGPKNCVQVAWHPTDTNYVVSLHVVNAASCFICLWSVETGMKVWMTEFQQKVRSFVFDPYDPSSMALISNGWLWTVADFGIQHPPLVVKKYKMVTSNPLAKLVTQGSGTSRPASRNPSVSSRSSPAERESSSAMGVFSSILSMGSVDLQRATKLKPPPTEEVHALDETTFAVDVTFSLNRRGVLIIVFNRELVFFDVEIGQILGIQHLESGTGNYTKIMPTRDNGGILFFQHDNNTLSARHAKGDLAHFRVTTLATTDPLKLKRSERVFGAVLNPRSEASVFVIAQSGKMFVFSLMVNFTDRAQIPVTVKASSSYVMPKGITSSSYSFLLLGYLDQVPAAATCLAVFPHYRKFNTSNWADEFRQRYKKTMLKPSAPTPRATMPRMSIAGSLAVAYVQPNSGPIDATNSATDEEHDTSGALTYEPLVILGRESGYILLFDVKLGQTLLEIAVHNKPITGISWTHSHLVYTYCVEKLPNEKYRNAICATDLRTGRVHTVRSNKHTESAGITGLSFSPSCRYALICFGGAKPVELWDMGKFGNLIEMPNFSDICSVTWRNAHQRDVSSGEDDRFDREHFAIATRTGRINSFALSDRVVKPDFSLELPGGTRTQCTSLEWSEDHMVAGDDHGNITLWRTGMAKPQVIHTQHANVVNLVFMPMSGFARFLVLFGDGIELWDAQSGTKLSAVVGRKPGGAKERLVMKNVEWIGNMPLLVCEDGSIRLIDSAMRGATSPMSNYPLPAGLWCPPLNDPKINHHLKSLLRNQRWRVGQEFSIRDAIDEVDTVNMEELLEHLHLFGRNIIDQLENHCPKGTSQRCLVVAEVFGDHSEHDFWKYAIHYLAVGPVQAIERDTLLVKESEIFWNLDEDDTQPLADPPSNTSFSSTNAVAHLPAGDLDVKELGQAHHLVASDSSIKRHLTQRLAARTHMPANNELSQRIVQDLIFAGKHREAIHRLMKIDPAHPRFVEDAYKTVSIASLHLEKDERESVITLTAVNMMSSGHVTDGVQMLCIIGKYATACNYLQTYGMWEKAAMLAKSKLTREEYSAILQRHVEYLASPRMNRIVEAVKLSLSLGSFVKTLELMLRIDSPSLACLFMHSLEEYGYLDCTLTQEDVKLIDETELNEQTPETHRKSLVRRVYREYAEYLMKMENVKASHYYCDLTLDPILKELLSTPQPLPPSKT